MTAVSPPPRRSTSLEDRRRERGWSRETLAALAGLSPRTIYAIEVEGVHAQRATRRVLALALDCEPADLSPSNNSEAAGTNRGSAKTAGAGDGYGER